MPSVKVSMVLRPECRNSSGVARAVEVATKLGLRVTATGSSTLSAEADENTFERLFQTGVAPVPERLPSPTDFGAPPGFSTTDEEPRVPAALDPLVSHVGVAPPHTRLR
jgi:hypothetical protein